MYTNKLTNVKIGSELIVFIWLYCVILYIYCWLYCVILYIY